MKLYTSVVLFIYFRAEQNFVFVVLILERRKNINRAKLVCGTQFAVEFRLTNHKIWRLIELELSLKLI